MKNAIIAGIIIGVLSGLWLFVMHSLGYSPRVSSLAGIEYFSAIIPLVVLYFGLRSYRSTDCGGHMGFLEALLQCFKILLIGGVISIAAAIIYVDEISGGDITDFSGRMFGALLVGLLGALGVAALLTTKPNKVD